MSHLTPAQLATLKAAINADPQLAAQPNTGDGNAAIVALLAAEASPAYWAWRSAVTKLEITSSPSPDATSWSWTAYIARNVAEKDAWREMFSVDGTVNPSLANVRAAFADIFSGAPGATTRAHLLAIGRRKVTRGERIFVAATVGGAGQRGSTANPDTMAVEGTIDAQDIESARNLA